MHFYLAILKETTYRSP